MKNPTTPCTLMQHASRALSFVALAALLTSCSTPPFKDTYTLKKKAATTIGGNEGYTTIWNEAKPCAIGRIYFAHAGNNGIVLDTYTADYAVSGAAWSDAPAPVSGNFTYNVTNKPDVKAQVSYLGVEANFSAKPVKSVTFSMDGADATNLREFPKLEQLVDANIEEGRRVEILNDTLTRATNKTPPIYWIVTGILTGKNLKISFEKDGNWSGKLGVADGSALKAMLSAQTMATGSLEIGDSSTNKQTFENKDVQPVAVTMFPLSATKSPDGSIHVYFDKVQKPLVAINTQKL
ncbi:MAG: hypothetical protein ABJF10_23600 [Chthoniobacter sp.]|uniref:hypothetical protein n=1 Tax=Chthoniobacter sp. TaxID=2510640 RepID=UPI0032A835D9